MEIPVKSQGELTLVRRTLEDGFFRRFDLVRVNIKSCPIVNQVVLMGRDGNDANVRPLAQHAVAEARPFTDFFLGDNDDVRVGLGNALRKVGLIGHFADNFNVGLIRKRRQNKFTHQTGSIRNQHANGLFHIDPHKGGHYLPSTVSWSKDPKSAVGWYPRRSNAGNCPDRASTNFGLMHLGFVADVLSSSAGVLVTYIPLIITTLSLVDNHAFLLIPCLQMTDATACLRGQ